MKLIWGFVGTVLFLGVTAKSLNASADHPLPTRVSAFEIEQGPMQRLFIETTPGEDERILSFRRSLIERGARNVNLFWPSIIVCDIPLEWSPAEVVDDPAFRVFDPQTVAMGRVSSALPSELPVALDAYDLARRIIGSAPVEELDPSLFNDVVVMVPPEIVEKSKEMAARSSGVLAAPARNIQQNSEFLIGDVLAQFVLPESDGHAEDWTDGELATAVAGGAAACLAFQQTFSYVSMNFIFVSVKQAPTTYEPIHHNMDTDELWIGDVMKNLGFTNREVSLAVHDYNNAGRAKFGTDWVYTGFVARSVNEPGHHFRGAFYTAYANGGGPYLVMPFPAGDNNGDPPLPEEQIYSQIFQHEMVHIFWGLDEYIADTNVSNCNTRTGYLDYSHKNRLSRSPSGEVLGCPTYVPCIMWNARGDGRPVCKYTAGQIGVADDNANGIPDVFDAPPAVEFESSDADTTSEGTMTVNMTVRSQAVPNRNRFQSVETRVDYAAPLRDATFSVNGVGATRLKPLDGRWDEVEEDLTLRLTGLTPGLTRVQVRARNAYGRASGDYVKRIYFIGVKYALFDFVAHPNSIEVKWSTIGETFGAELVLTRIDIGADNPVPVALDTFPPPENPDEVFHNYRYVDEDILPGREYRYQVVGTIVLDKEYTSPSGVFSVRGMLPIAKGEIISFVSPNPFRESTILSVDIPKTLQRSQGDPGSGTSGIPEEVATNVRITVYDVKGRRVRDIYRGARFGGIETFVWEGTDRNGEPVPSGVYFIKAEAGPTTAVKKVVVLR